MPYLPMKLPDKAPLTLESYVRAIGHSRLLDGDSVEAAIEELARDKGTQPSSVELARRLERQDLLTPWQNGWLLAGEHRRLVFGPYKLLDRDARGYVAEDRQDRRRVNLKFLSAQTSYAHRAQQELELFGKLQHPHLLPLIQAGEIDSWHFLALESTPTNLAEIVRCEGPLAYDRAAQCIRQAADGLAYAHSNGFVHRDIKPSELLVDAAGAIRIDVPGWRWEEPEDWQNVEHLENVLGTTDYLAPFTAIDSHSVDPHFDVYSLGCVLYFALTGHAPFVSGGTLAQRLMKHAYQDPPAITIDRPDCPADLIAICWKMKSRKQAEIYSAAEASAALSAWLERYERGEIAPPPAPEPPNEPETLPSMGSLAAKWQRSWWPW